MANKNCIIIHGCPSDKKKAMDPETRNYDKQWLSWTKKELDSKGIKTEVPLMPSPWEPIYEDYKTEFEKLNINENTILIGTSCGCTFLVRWLGETKRKIHKLILVAPWKMKDGADDFVRAFYYFSIDKTIRDRVDEIVMFTADNEAVDGKKGLKMFYEALGGEIINMNGYGHYMMRDMGTEEFPKLINVVIK